MRPTASSLLKAADLALFRAKTDGRGTYRFFEYAMDEKSRRAMHWSATCAKH